MTWDLNLGQQAILLTIRGRTSPTSLLAPVSSTGKEEGGVQEEIQHSQSIHGKWLAVGGDVYARERQQAGRLQQVREHRSSPCLGLGVIADACTCKPVNTRQGKLVLTEALIGKHISSRCFHHLSQLIGL